MKKTNKPISLALTAAMLISGVTAVAYADAPDGNDTTGTYTQTVELKNSDTKFNRVVVDSAPEDIQIEYSNDNGANWTNITASEYNGQLINDNGTIGFLYGRFGNSTSGVDTKLNVANLNGKYAEYTADKIRISSATTDISEYPVKVYYATDVAPDSTKINSDSTCFTMKNGETELYSKFIFSNPRLNNPTIGTPAYIYGIAKEDGPADSSNGYANNGSDTTVQKYTTADVTIKLNQKATVSQISYGNIHESGNENTSILGTNCTISYLSGNDWTNLATINSSTVKHISVSTPASAETDTVKMSFTFGTKSDSGRTPALALSYIGIYDFGANLAKPSNYTTLSLGDSVTFNQITSSENTASLEFLTSDGWTSYEEGATLTATTVRVPNAEGEETAVIPSFSLSWNGNLVEYADKKYNGSSFNKTDTNSPHLYDNLNNTSMNVAATENNGNFIFNFNAPAQITGAITTKFGNGCWYPVAYSVYTSNTGNNWAIQAAENYDFLLDSLGWHGRGTQHDDYGEFTTSGDPAVHNQTPQGNVTLPNTKAAMLKIAYRGSMRKYCEDATQGNTNSTITDIMVQELQIPGTVSILNYNGTNVTSPSIPITDPTAAGITEPTGTITPNVVKASLVNTFVKNITADESEDIKTGTNATAVLSTIKITSGTVNKITWNFGNDHTGVFDSSHQDFTTTLTGGNAIIGLIIDWQTEEIPEGLKGLNDGDKISTSVISTAIN